jgi:hypothetical protein
VIGSATPSSAAMLRVPPASSESSPLPSACSLTKFVDVSSGLGGAGHLRGGLAVNFVPKGCLRLLVSERDGLSCEFNPDAGLDMCQEVSIDLSQERPKFHFWQMNDSSFLLVVCRECRRKLLLEFFPPHVEFLLTTVVK